MTPGTLYVVATPIGNLEDVTLRALSVLRSVAVIACEDTRRTRVLLDRHGVTGRLVAFHKFNEAKASPSLVSRMLAGEDVALVSDGGTPAISDPGYRLVRDALDVGITVTPIPGPSAFVAAVSASGLPSERIVFVGFLPHRKGERRRMMETMRNERGTHVLYESPHRIEACLEDLRDVLGNRRAAVARELTKRYETWHRGTLDQIVEAVAAGSKKGEFCIVIEGPTTGGSKRARDSNIRADDHPDDSGKEPLEKADPFVADSAMDAGDRDREDGTKSSTARISASTGTGRLPRGLARRPSATEADAHGPDEASPSRLRDLYEAAIASGLDRRAALRSAARECGLSRKEAYRVLHPD